MSRGVDPVQSRPALWRTVERADLTGAVGAQGQRDHGCGAPAAQDPDDLDPVEVGQRTSRVPNSGLSVAEATRVGTDSGGKDLVVVGPQGDGQDPEDLRLVVHYQHAVTSPPGR
jgi:hypothetical protein